MWCRIRPCLAFRLVRKCCVARARNDAHPLPMHQKAFFFSTFLDPPQHTGRGLPARLGVTKPVITRALDTMGALKLVSRHRDELDKRNVLIRRTVEGALFVERFGDGIIARAHELPI